jgi:hypothetical protein
MRREGEEFTRAVRFAHGETKVPNLFQDLTQEAGVDRSLDLVRGFVGVRNDPQKIGNNWKLRMLNHY